MSTPTVQFLFDFGSPNAYLCHKTLPHLSERTGAWVEYVPILLGGLFKLANNRSPAEAHADIPNKRAYEALESQRFIKRHSITAFRPNTFFPVNTLVLMRGAVAAQNLNCFESYVDAAFACMWEKSLNMALPEVFLAAMEDAGLPATAILTATQDPDVKNRLLVNTQNAFDKGAFGAPSYLVGDELFFGKDRMSDVEEEIVAQQKL